MLKENFQLLAQYNQWMNKRVFEAAAKLSQDDLTRDAGAFFGSVLGTLNHILVADILWLKRFANHPAQFESLEKVQHMQNPDSLSAVLHGTLDSLQQVRLEFDVDIIDFCDEITESQLQGSLDYKNTQGLSYQDQFGLLIQHLFNHQTHHRGQLTTLLSQHKIDVGATDLLVCIREK